MKKEKQICVVAQENEEIGATFVLVGVWESDGLSGGNDLSDGSRGTILAGRSARRSRGGTGKGSVVGGMIRLFLYYVFTALGIR